jgi:hypothetical protein
MEDKEFNDLEKRFVAESLDKPDLLRLNVSKFALDGIQEGNYIDRAIAIDGGASDWEGIKPLIIDKVGDAEDNIDIKELYAGIDEDNLYLMVKLNGKPTPQDCYYVSLDVDVDGKVDYYTNFYPSGDILLFKQEWTPEKFYEVPHDGCKIASNNNITEIRIPLRLIGNPEETKISLIIAQTGDHDETGSKTLMKYGDFQKLNSFNPPLAGKLGYLADDLQGLPGILDGISSEEAEAIKQLEAIVKSSKEDYQLRKGICLIDEYGVPDQELFIFRVPNHNTSLQALFNLAQDREIPEDYYKPALASGLDYGFVVTIGNDEVDAAVRNYVPQIFDHILETDQIIKQHGADWQAKDYPLEAAIGLVW